MGSNVVASQCARTSAEVANVAQCASSCAAPSASSVASRSLMTNQFSVVRTTSMQTLRESFSPSRPSARPRPMVQPKAVRGPSSLSTRIDVGGPRCARTASAAALNSSSRDSNARACSDIYSGDLRRDTGHTIHPWQLTWEQDVILLCSALQAKCFSRIAVLSRELQERLLSGTMKALTLALCLTVGLSPASI